MDLEKKWNRIILGSQSPRRKELLAGLDVKFDIQVADIDESFPENMETSDVAEFIAKNKLKAIQSAANNGELIICSDTIVVLDGNILGKPKDKAEATKMLATLSGRTHLVISAVAMADDKKQVSFSDKTEVTFKDLSSEEIDYYLSNYEPYDKAGSYGVQEWIGMVGITNMNGSYFTVMGLPVHRVYDTLKSW